MKNNTPIAFNFNELAVRIIPDVEQPLFVAKDVASSGNPRFNGIRAVRSCLINEPKKCWVFEV